MKRFYLTAAVFTGLTSCAFAQLTWDPDGDQTSNGGAGTWDLATANWDDNGVAPNTTWVNGNNATFGDSAGNYTVSVDTGSVVTVTDLNYEGTDKLTFASLLGDSMITLAGNAAWNTGGGTIEFASDQSAVADLGDVGLDLAGFTLTVNGGGEFDAGERGNGVDWVAGNLVFSAATTVRGDTYNIGQLTSVTMADGSSFIMERNFNRDISNDWVLNGDVTFGNRFDGRTVWANGVFSGTGRLIVDGMGTQASGNNGFLRLNNAANSWSGGLTVDGSASDTVVVIAGGENRFGAVPGAFDADNIILKDGGMLEMNNISINANRGITLEGAGGGFVNLNNPNTVNGAITGSGALIIGRTSDGAANATILMSTANDYTGDSNIVRGTLRLGADNTTSPTSVVVIGGNNATSTFDINGKSTTIGGLKLAGANTRRLLNNGAASTLTIDVADGGDHFYNGDIVGTGDINIVKTGLGTQTISRGSSGSFTKALGSIEANGGTLKLTIPNSGQITGTISVGAAGTLQVGDGGTIGTIDNIAVANAGTLIFNRSDAETYGGDISGSGSIQIDGGGTITLTGDNSGATGSVTVNAGSTLAGTGTIGGATTINGTHSPGTSPGIQNLHRGHQLQRDLDSGHRRVDQ